MGATSSIFCQRNQITPLHQRLTAMDARSASVQELVKRLGPDHGSMHWDLVKVIFCHECRAAGRDDRNLQFTNHAMTPEQRKGWTPCP
ncbi:hypothetical protein EN828_12335 [Mesorhizobium sp. M2D.F.Ca.ET.185.01.1.1]|uniref:hypothetical protein n=1 Tax=unclassified Mesorhizobium TaxID=325217 RepID=UPI000FCA94D2|nr:MULTISPECIES: hypothetical protein [unclassified Mesorhizobium]TGP52676.1 hypothetical protein EN873_15545 [bacterium M00.F.Ca.ET.230.01.1.1]TGP81055.1 hypothetical protein EN870_11115 [bacterium M00.F.Ca.ET.227.01.1.1]TGP90838.1 hypothetical protein EN864_18985 [bacterium M00.F.Ca.ET.221.01.1.1]TGS32971.1 hypothetical protein EN828_12335 [Mesorhizobium sp. M2D.F.Ca.ET.185.01.1.1]TGU47228.1 hypothetical protein EN789_14480 [bacterium M00.F.Ca.ET.146.01.1.1]TGU61099.1 hypothetical protein E